MSADKLSSVTGIWGEKLLPLFANESDIEFAILIGSRASDRAHIDSDWDIVVQWNAALPWLDMLGSTETLRRKLAALSVRPRKKSTSSNFAERIWPCAPKFPRREYRSKEAKAWSGHVF
ncbi:nucleotidyltransferase domain-containing protein [Candidatus Methylospira mobilis]|uniref:nucleotidyltransferase domain-containing protein n=1 Tax=Candidatus Methylospira mobilis TaxID=1808979 RepID=UPI001D172B0A|nr:nucleotidyltransferase domain-containing protein [Candidatus Methylospira mobilis]WNV06631.1 nucleotidyltransferase domain-containing protein [Candidatus Methylospira mobilis]